MTEVGYLAGEVCNRDGCTGIIDEHEPDEGCTCFISPPCSSCTTSREFCPVCDWDGEEEQRLDEERERRRWEISRILKPEKPRPWIQPIPKWNDDLRIKYQFQSMRGAPAMRVVGTYPYASDPKDRGGPEAFPDALIQKLIVKEVMNSYFGGRWESYGYGRFVFIKYTD